MNNLHQENLLLRRRLGELTAEALDNEIKLGRIQKLELELLDSQCLAELLERLTVRTLASFALDAVCLVLADPDCEIRRLLEAQQAGCLLERHVVLVDDLPGFDTQYRRLPGVWLGGYRRSVHSALFVGRLGLKSLALLPLRRHGTLVGSLNLGSADPDRYTRDHAQDFLRHFAALAAVCLENAIYRERLRTISFTDRVTGCPNRHYLDRRLAEAVAVVQRYAQPLACLFLDIDHFKSVNDRHGHAAGDQVLREVAGRIARELRASDVLARYGGEEFAVLLPQTTGAEALRLAERIRGVVAGEPIPFGGDQQIAVTVSIGVGEVPPEPGLGGDVLGQRLLAAADAGLYRAKAEGRNRVSRASGIA